MHTVFKYIYPAVRMFYAFRRPHVKGSDIHFIHTQTINRPHLPDSPNTLQPPLPFQTATLAVRHISLHLPKNHPIVSIHARKAV